MDLSGWEQNLRSGKLPFTTSDYVSEQPKRPPQVMLLVVGVGRSGTSTVTRALECLGAVNSMRLVPSNCANPKGFFEDNEVYRFNEHVLLPALNRKWCSVAPVDWSILNSTELGHLERQAINLIQVNYPPGKSLYVLKEPRITALLPFWIPVIEKVGFDVQFVGVVRDPVSVSRSLRKVNGISEVLGSVLYCSNWCSALIENAGKPFALIAFDELFSDARSALLRLADRLQTKRPDDFEEKLKLFLETHLDANLRHTSFNVEEVFREQNCLPIAKELYALLQEAVNSQSIDQAASRAVGIMSFLAGSSQLLRDYDGVWDEVLEARKAIVDLSENSAAQTRENSKLIKTIQEMQASKCKFEETIQEMQARKCKLEETIQEMQASKSWRLTAPLRAAASTMRKI